MSKKHHKNEVKYPTCPEWEKLNIDVTQGGNLNITMVQDMQDKWHYYNNPESIDLAPNDRKNIFENWDAFESNQGFTPTVLEALHLKEFGVPIPKYSTRVYTTVAIWKKWFMEGKSHLKATPSATKAKTPSKTLSRTYKLLESPKESSLKTPQAIACLKIITESVSESKTITEESLKKIIYDRQAELKTRQDPWRIFQYYRPQLIAGKYITHD